MSIKIDWQNFSEKAYKNVQQKMKGIHSMDDIREDCLPEFVTANGLEYGFYMYFNEKNNEAGAYLVASDGYLDPCPEKNPGGDFYPNFPASSLQDMSYTSFKKQVGEAIESDIRKGIQIGNIAPEIMDSTCGRMADLCLANANNNLPPCKVEFPERFPAGEKPHDLYGHYLHPIEGFLDSSSRNDEAPSISKYVDDNHYVKVMQGTCTQHGSSSVYVNRGEGEELVLKEVNFIKARKSALKCLAELDHKHTPTR